MFQHVVDGDHRGVLDPGGGPGLLLRPGVQDVPVGLSDVQTRRQFLYGDRPVQQLVVCAPHLAHAATADGLDEPVPAREHRTRACLLFH